VVLTAEGNWLKRFGGITIIAYGLYLALAAGSRGGLVAFVVMSGFVMIRASWVQRIGFVVAFFLVTILAVAVLPQHIRTRYSTIFSDDHADQEAVDSKAARTYLLKSSISFTLQHPLFGIGPGEFSDYEGHTARESGKHGAWQVSHNTYTQVSSEAGIPALLFMLGALVSTYRILNKVYSESRYRTEYRSIAMAALCLQISMVAFCITIFFLSLAYNFYLLALSGIAIALSSAAQAEFVIGSRRAASSVRNAATP